MTDIEPIRREITVAASPELAFEVFTARLDTWWPLETHSRAADGFADDGLKVERVDFQPYVGGSVLEHLSNGEVLSWAEVLTFEPPTRFVLAWKPNSRPTPPTELEIRFVPDGEGTRVELEHRGWERFDDVMVEARSSYGEGWIKTLERFAAEVERRVA